MFTETVIQKLKQNNISVDAEKTKQRVSEIWRAADKVDKDTIQALAGVVRSTIHRAYKTGSISAKLVVPIAQTLNINPFYLTGTVDERGECSDELIKELLQTHQYGDLLAEHAREEQKQLRKAKREAALAEAPPAAQKTEEEIMIRFDEEMKTAIQEAAQEYDIDSAVEADSKLIAESLPQETASQFLLDSITEDDMILLLKAIMLKAKAGGKYAELATQLKLLLLS